MLRATLNRLVCTGKATRHGMRRAYLSWVRTKEVLLMRDDRENLKDPTSGYASADLLDPTPETEDQASEADRPGNQRDPMSGYASADTLDATPEVSQAEPAQDSPDAERDPMSGYASADVMDPEPVESDRH
jgi:hypothetical protein